MKKSFTFLSVLALTALLASGCGVADQTGPAPGTQPRTGSIEVRVTDAPRSDNISEVWVTVSEVRAHRAVAEQQQSPSPSPTNGSETEGQLAGNEAEEPGEWVTIPVTGENPFDLLKLRGGGASGGLQQVLGVANVTAGKYTQVRLAVTKVEVKINGVLKPATLPSGKLKFVHPFEVVGGQATVLLFDFDADKSVNVTGNEKIMVKPVVKLQVSKGKGAGPTTPAGGVTITTTVLPRGVVGISYSAALAATGGTLPYTWNVTSGSLPGGLSLNATSGVISGTPTAAGGFVFTVGVSDNSTPARSDTQDLTINIAAAGEVVITTASLPAGERGQAYSATVAAAGGTTPYTWGISAGALPDGLALSTGGTINGTPTRAGNFAFTIQVTDNSTPAKTAAQGFTIRIKG